MRQGRLVIGIAQRHQFWDRGKEQNAQSLGGLLLNHRLQVAPRMQGRCEYLYRTQNIGTPHGLIIHDQSAPFIGRRERQLLPHMTCLARTRSPYRRTRRVAYRTARDIVTKQSS